MTAQQLKMPRRDCLGCSPVSPFHESALHAEAVVHKSMRTEHRCNSFCQYFAYLHNVYVRLSLRALRECGWIPHAQSLHDRMARAKSFAQPAV